MKELIERIKIKGSPFWVVGNKEQGYFLVFGKYKLTENSKTAAEAIKRLKEETYDIICKMVLSIVSDPDVQREADAEKYQRKQEAKQDGPEGLLKEMEASGVLKDVEEQMGIKIHKQ